MYFDPWPERMALFQSMLFTMYQKSGLGTGASVKFRKAVCNNSLYFG